MKVLVTGGAGFIGTHLVERHIQYIILAEHGAIDVQGLLEFGITHIKVNLKRKSEDFGQALYIRFFIIITDF